MATTLYPGIPFSPQATLTDNIGAADTIIKVSDVSAFPDPPNLATIGTDEEGETILYTAKTPDALSGCQRGVEGTARAWTAGELIGRNFTAKDHADLIAAVSETREAATTAATDAAQAKEDAQTAADAASTAQGAAETAQTAATSASSAASSAQEEAGEAKKAAGEAMEAATEAAEAATTAATDAAQAKEDAQTAADAASTAQGAAETAQTAATSASSAASSAQEEAGEAKKAAGEAVETATAAADIATAAAEVAATAATDAAQAKEDAQTAAEKSLEDALAADVGRSMAGKTVEPEQGTTVTAGTGAEIFNDYRERVYGADEGHEAITAQRGNIASGSRAHAEGSTSTASGLNSHAEGFGTTASGSASHAEGGRFTGQVGSIASGYSAHAEGTSTTASGGGAHSEGRGTVASAEAAHAEGYSTQAIGIDSHAEGYMGIAEGIASHVEGGIITNKEANKASGYAAHAEGASTLASGNESHAEGRETIASGDWSHAEGIRTVASGYDAHAEGIDTQALATNSHAGGQGTLAEYFAETTIGRWNVRKSPATSSPLGDLFVVGKGTNDTARANAFRVNHSGVYGTGAFNASGADYAELFEWADGNLARMDRTGRFVTLEGEHIRLAGPGDDYILGIVSGAPSVVGDVYDDQWQGMYLTDVFGRPIWEDVEVPDVTETFPDPENPESTISRIIIPAHTERRQKLNPDYDPAQTYVPRSDRPEWDAVGLLGKLVAVDDGTCVPNGWATVGEGGAATASPERTRYRVMARLDERHVRILIL